ncbi:MAG: 3-deoxy-D-manno-octulosonic acid transferase, partial [Gammaproteobacteria bacterium]|nr:3-deoxy-D-manno-octulosonic acid transferase [Gammaproteobacteria bacterium]
MYYLYVVIITMLLPVELCRLYFKSIRDHGMRLRLKGTFYPHTGIHFSKPVIWIHAVSVGEVQACKPLVEQLQNTCPDYQFLVTTVTTTGAELTAKIFNSDVTHSYLPYDHPFFVQRFLNVINPAILVVAETEIWPVLYKLCKARHIPIIIANARLTDKSFHRYRKVRSLVRQTLEQVDAIVAQSQANADKFKALIVDKNKVSVNKNLKFHMTTTISSDFNDHALKLLIKNRQVIIAASTHPGEEEILTNAFKKISQGPTECFFIIVPRHPERAKDVQRIVSNVGFRAVFYTDQPSWHSDCNVLIVDVIGVLQQLYSIADLVVMGGSFVPIGGHNMLEPAMISKAIVTGPYLDNFLEIYGLLDEVGGILKVKDELELVSTASELIENPDKREQMGLRA